MDNLLADTHDSPAYILSNGDTLVVPSGSKIRFTNQANVVILNTTPAWVYDYSWAYTPWYFRDFYYWHRPFHWYYDPWYYDFAWYRDPWYYDWYYRPYRYYGYYSYYAPVTTAPGIMTAGITVPMPTAPAGIISTAGIMATM